MTDLQLQSTTGNPSQYEVIADERIVGRIALYKGCSIALIDMATTSDGASATVKNPGAASLHQRTQTQRPPPRWQTRLSG